MIQIICGILWVILGVVNIGKVDNWSLFWDGSTGHWWFCIGLPIYVASLLFRIAYLKYNRSKDE